MVIPILKLTRVRNVSLILAAFTFMICGCSNEPVVVKIVYETQAISESPDADFESVPIPRDAYGANEAQTRDDDVANAALSQTEEMHGTPQATYRASAPSPAVTGTPQPTFTPWPTPTLTPSPTPQPTPTATPSPVPTPTPIPTAVPSPSPQATANLQAAIDAETERYARQFAGKNGLVSRRCRCLAGGDRRAASRDRCPGERSSCKNERGVGAAPYSGRFSWWIGTGSQKPPKGSGGGRSQPTIAAGCRSISQPCKLKNRQMPVF